MCLSIYTFLQLIAYTFKYVWVTSNEMNLFAQNYEQYMLNGETEFRLSLKHACLACSLHGI